MTSKLKPCPFCGNDGKGQIEDALHVSMQEHEWRNTSWTVQCDKCSATTGYCHDEDDAISTWNTRAGEPVASTGAATLDELKAEIDAYLEDE